ncbi:MAG: hypothetical protein IKJ55_05540, partial [Clostridia bacterium]|nr:hypothetical protein [Clostridia bacterium]
MKNMTSLFLSQSYRDTWEDYTYSLTRENFVCWDYVVLTASNQKQAEGFMMQIQDRQAKGLLSSKTHFAVIPDPDGK